ncbi:MAG: hypothetical protein M3373_11675 [Gemmatimonadota bacterium]|nr:hypothetical protein [Gemmatimonadota bacterium]
MPHAPFALRLALPALVLALPLAGAAAQGRDTTKSPAAATPTIPPPVARAGDVASIDAIIEALYDVISGPAGQKRDWDRFRSLFAPGARLIVARPLETGGAQAVVMDPERYVERAGPGLERDGFFERELSHKTETFGNIAHRFSTYDSRRAEDDAEPFARGINSIQLLKDGGRWWVVTVFWDSERPGSPIPRAYLPN